MLTCYFAQGPPDEGIFFQKPETDERGEDSSRVDVFIANVEYANSVPGDASDREESSQLHHARPRIKAQKQFDQGIVHQTKDATTERSKINSRPAAECTRKRAHHLKTVARVSKSRPANGGGNDTNKKIIKVTTGTRHAVECGPSVVGFGNKVGFISRHRSVTSLPGLRRIDFVAAAPFPYYERSDDLDTSPPTIGFACEGEGGGAEECGGRRGRSSATTEKRIEYIGRMRENVDHDPVTQLKSQSSSCIAIDERVRDSRSKRRLRREQQRMPPTPACRCPSSTSLSSSSFSSASRAKSEVIRRSKSGERGDDGGGGGYGNKIEQGSFVQQTREFEEKSPQDRVLQQQLLSQRQSQQLASTEFVHPQQQFSARSQTLQCNPYGGEGGFDNRNRSNITPSEFDRSEESFLNRRRQVQEV